VGHHRTLPQLGESFTAVLVCIFSNPTALQHLLSHAISLRCLIACKRDTGPWATPHYGPALGKNCGLSSLNQYRMPERGARIARREERVYWA
jgi:hypothetical protein